MIWSTPLKKYRETEGVKVRRLGYALDAATLQQIAYDNGIRQNINTMTQAQKSQLRYVAILQQSTNVMGDMARTIVTPANSMRIMNQQIMQFKRAIGNVVSVFAVKIIPYLQVGIRLLTDFANYLANLWGFKLPEIDYSKVGNGLSAVEDDADDATDAVKDTIKAVQRLAGFDEINVLKSAKEDADDTAAALGNQFDLGIDLPEYDFLQGVENSTEELYQKVKAWLLEVYEWLKKHKDLIKTIVKLIASIWVVNKISKFIDKLSIVSKLFKNTGSEIEGVQTKYSSLRQALGVTFGTIATSLGSFNFFKDLTSGAMDASGAITELITVGGGLAVAFASGGVVGGVLATIGGVIFGIAGTIAGFNEKIEKTLKLINDQAWKTGGLNISDAANIIDEYATTLTSSETKLLEDAAKIKTLRDDIKDINSNIDILFESIRNTDEVDTSAVDKIKDAFNELTTATKNYFTQNGDMLKVYFKSNESMFESLGMTYSQFSKAIDNATGNASKNIENLQKELDTILSKDNLTSEDFAYIQTLEDRIRAMTGLNVDESTKQINELTNSIKSLASVPVNLESADTAKKSIDKMTKSVGTALKTLNDAHQEAVNAVNVLYSAGGITADEKNSMIKSLNEIYDVKKLKLHDVTHTITNYGEQIGKALESVRQNYIEEAFDYNMADYQKMLDLQSKGYVGNIFSTNINNVALARLESKYKDAIKKFNSYLKEHNLTDYWVENTSDYITQQITLSSGMTYEAVQDFIKNHMTNAKNLLKDAIKILPLASSIKNLFSKSLSETKSPLSSGLKSFSESVLSNLFGKDTMTSAKNSIKSAYTSLWDNILATNQDGAQRTSSKLSNSIRSIWSSVKSSTSGSAKIAADEITKAFTANLAIPIGFSATLASQTQNAVNNTKSQITKSGSLLGDAFGTGFENSVDDAIRKAIQDSVIAAANVGSFVGAAATVGTSKGISNSNALVDWFRKLKIPGFASGGIVDGDLFLANENGRAEFISSIGNKAAVANQDQMRSEIRQGVKEGMLEALSRQSNGGDIYVYLDSDEVAYRLERNTAANTKRTGGR